MQPRLEVQLQRPKRAEVREFQVGDVHWREYRTRTALTAATLALATEDDAEGER